jgi:hypothetical protein
VKETKSLSLYAQLQLPVSNALLASQGKCSAHVPQRGHGPAAHAQDSGIGTSAFEVQKKKDGDDGNRNKANHDTRLQTLAAPYWRLDNKPS